MRKELNIFLTALQFYTRIPCGRWIDHQSTHLNAATRYLPVIGWIAGLASGGSMLLAGTLFDPAISVLLSMAATVLLTGAFHEDGLADFCDGFGGGWTKERILEIMKDSRTGTYGVVGLVLMLLTKFAALHEIFTQIRHAPLPLLLLLVTAQTVSRFTASTFIFTHRYARQSGDSKAKPVAEEVMISNLFVSAFFALLPFAILLIVAHTAYLLVMLPMLYLFTWFFGRYCNRWIGGYTGDCLGAAQQLSELIIYLTVIALWRFI